MIFFCVLLTWTHHQSSCEGRDFQPVRRYSWSLWTPLGHLRISDYQKVRMGHLVIKVFNSTMIQGDGAFYEDISYKWRNGGTWHPLESLVAVSIQATKPIVSPILNDNDILDPVFLLTSKIESSGVCVFWRQSSPWGWWRWGRTWWSCFRRRPAHPPGNLPPVEVVCY